MQHHTLDLITSIRHFAELHQFGLSFPKEGVFLILVVKLDLQNPLRMHSVYQLALIPELRSISTHSYQSADYQTLIMIILSLIC